MYSMFSKNITKMFSEFHKIAPFPKAIIKSGSIIFLIIFLAGIIFFTINCMINNNPYFELISTSIIESSFTILAEVIIGGLVIDYVFRK